MQVETVKIKSGKGDYAIINKSDFDKKAHVLFGKAKTYNPEIPDNLGELTESELISLASEILGETVASKEDAEIIIVAELDQRKGLK